LEPRGGAKTAAPEDGQFFFLFFLFLLFPKNPPPPPKPLQTGAIRLQTLLETALSRKFGPIKRALRESEKNKKQKKTKKKNKKRKKSQKNTKVDAALLLELFSFL
jgi:hypothetical protein